MALLHDLLKVCIICFGYTNLRFYKAKINTFPQLLCISKTNKWEMLLIKSCPNSSERKTKALLPSVLFLLLLA